MGIINEKSISDAKQHLPSIIREASAGYEVITKNYKSTGEAKVSIISTDIFEEILDANYKFTPQIEEDREVGGFTISLNELLIHGEGSTLSDAMQDLAENVMDYAADYLKRIDFFRQIENRKSHYPYLRRLARYSDINRIMEVIAECHTGLQQAISKK
ncbi:MAG: hypothetical protein A2Y21_01380 [Clostridiales bacterium GWC2_40_7]|nr:MAG: hypothetical protein A2Y21_01380 [Clostridiales bacterium GWC2_40_7]